jgi:molybdate transport system substrate-binding protein
MTLQLPRAYRCGRHIAACLVVMLAVVAGPAHGREVKVAVAANFIEPMKEIAAAFTKASDHKLVLSFGATGQFYIQIMQGAPFEVFVAADKATPAKVVAEGAAVPGTAFTYAVGRVVLYGKAIDPAHGEATLKEARFTKLAIANPATAPYGAAAVQAMMALGVYDALAPKIVQGNNIAQALQFIDTGNADLGFVALSQVVFADEGAKWVVPERLHAPLAQDAVLLKAAAGNDAARAFLDFLKGPEARATIKKFGYGFSE